MTSISFPINVVNYICELAAGNDKKWYPLFSPKTGKVSWKVNPYCLEWIYSSEKFLNPIIDVHFTFYNTKTRENIQTHCKCKLLVQRSNWHKPTIFYFEFDTDNDERFMLRGMVYVYGHFVASDTSLYLNRTEYATIVEGFFSTDFSTELKRVTISYETY